MKSTEQNWVSFSANKIRGSKMLWYAQGKLPAIFSPEEMLEKYSYGLQGNLDPSKSIELIAERYGGDNIGFNGGGGRCGNYGNIQLKGVGSNCMVGDHDDIEHSYGGLDARKAVVETIYTHVLDKVLPLGTVNIHGLILTGEKTAFNGIERCWGVIMVRDVCLRPAHFMRAPSFKPKQQYKNVLVDDTARIRRLYKSVAKELGDKQYFIKIIGKYLQNSANQFAFARAARISHGTVSASNISLDGKWLDLPVSSFLNGGKNYNIWNEFYAEPRMAVKYALEILYNYSKYNNVHLNPNPLVHYFNEQYQAYFNHYIGYILGFDLNHMSSINAEKWQYISRCFNKLIGSAKHIESDRPAPGGFDPVHQLIIGLYISCASDHHSLGNIEHLLDKQVNINTLTSYFKACLSQYIEQKKSGLHTARSVVVAATLCALKRAFYAEAFYLSVIDSEVVALCNTKAPSEVKPLIDNYIAAAEWIFEDVSTAVILYKCKDLSIKYINDVYEVCIANCINQFDELSKLIVYLDELDSGLFYINNFFYKPFFPRIAEVVSLLDNLKLTINVTEQSLDCSYA